MSGAVYDVIPVDMVWRVGRESALLLSDLDKVAKLFLLI
jgi:hypothetical protein